MTNKNFEDLFECFNRRGVRALVVDAHAVAFHAKPRYTKDIDILVEPSVENAERILQALADFGFGSLDLSVDDFSRPGIVVQLGIGLAELRRAKQAAGRPQDLADLEWLKSPE